MLQRGPAVLLLSLLVISAIAGGVMAFEINVPMPVAHEERVSHLSNYYRANGTLTLLYYTFALQISSIESYEISVPLHIVIFFKNEDGAINYFVKFDIEGKQLTTFTLFLFDPHYAYDYEDEEWKYVYVSQSLVDPSLPSSLVTEYEVKSGLSDWESREDPWLFQTYEDWVDAGKPLIETMFIYGSSGGYEVGGWSWEITGLGDNPNGQITLPDASTISIAAVVSRPKWSLMAINFNVTYYRYRDHVVDVEGYTNQLGRERINELRLSASSPNLVAGESMMSGSPNFNSVLQFVTINGIPYEVGSSTCEYWNQPPFFDIYFPDDPIVHHRECGICFIHNRSFDLVLKPVFKHSGVVEIDDHILEYQLTITLSDGASTYSDHTRVGSNLVVPASTLSSFGQLITVNGLIEASAEGGTRVIKFHFSYKLLLEDDVNRILQSYKLIISKKSTGTEMGFERNESGAKIMAFEKTSSISGEVPDWYFPLWTPGVRALAVPDLEIQFGHVELLDYGTPGAPRIPVFIYGPGKEEVGLPDFNVLTVGGMTAKVESVGKLTIYSYWMRNRSGNLTALENVNWMTYETGDMGPQRIKNVSDEPWSEDELKEWILQRNESIIVVYPVGTPLALWYDNYDKANRTFDLVIRYGYPVVLESISMSVTLSDEEGVHYYTFTVSNGANVTVGTYNETRIYTVLGEWDGVPLWADKGSSVFVPEMIHSPSASYVSPAVQYLTWTIIIMVLFTILLLKRRWW